MRTDRAQPLTEADYALLFWSKVTVADNGCWVWSGARVTGYGLLAIRQSKVLAHRHAFMRCVGDIPEGLYVCHRCNNKPCVNPAHLYVADQRTNMQDAYRDGLMHPSNSLKVRCPKCEGAYTHNAAGRRICYACRRILNREYRRRRASIRAAMLASEEEK